MSKKKPVTEASENERRSVFDLAQRLWKNGSQLRRIRENMGLTKAAFARRAKITVQRLNGYEREGEMAGNFWLFCHDLKSFGIDPRMLDDPDFLDNLLGRDPKDRLKGGKEADRDPWYEWSGPKFKKFHRWAHRKYIEKMSDKDRERPIPKPTIKKWFDEWIAAGRPDAQEIIEE